MQAELIIDGKPFKGKNLIGQKFGRATVVDFDEIRRFQNGQKKYIWRCKCECGKEFSAEGFNIRSRHTNSCGCFKLERISESQTTHGGTPKLRDWHPLAQMWRQMIQRCRNEYSSSWKDYGGRGIRVCDRWKDFAAFRDDMFPTWVKGLQIERKDNDGNYEPSNCIWADRIQQAGNRRSSIRITRNGRTQCAAAWCRELGLAAELVRSRIKRGHSPEDSLEHYIRLQREKTPSIV